MMASDLIRELQAEIGVHGDCEITILIPDDNDGDAAEFTLGRIEHDPLQGEFPLRGPQFLLVGES